MDRNDKSFTEFFQAYLECAVWSSTGTWPEESAVEDVDREEPYPFEDFGLGVDDISETALKALEEEAWDFWTFLRDRVGEHVGDGVTLTEFAYEAVWKSPEQAGHDFWLTRNGHGAGFWDGGWEDSVGRQLTKASKTFGSCDLYLACTEDGSVKIEVA